MNDGTDRSELHKAWDASLAQRIAEAQAQARTAQARGAADWRMPDADGLAAVIEAIELAANDATAARRYLRSAAVLIRRAQAGEGGEAA